MFGYVKPKKPDLKIKEFEYYNSVYCGLCRAEKKLSKRLSLTLSYDGVLLALLRIGVSKEKSSFAKVRCAAHPFKKSLAVVSSPAIEYTAGAFALLVYYKLLDDICDEKGMKKISAKFILRGVKKAVEGSELTALGKSVSEKLEGISALEKEQCDTPYEAAELFGRLLGEIFAYDRDEEKTSEEVKNLEFDKNVCYNKKNPCKKKSDEKEPVEKEPYRLTRSDKLCLYEIGYRVGRWIYIVDAVADIKEDKSLGRYNPFIVSGVDTEGAEFKEDILFALRLELAAAITSLDLLSLEDKGVESIIRNILTLGLPEVAEGIFAEDNKKGKRKRAKKEPI